MIPGFSIDYRFVALGWLVLYVGLYALAATITWHFSEVIGQDEKPLVARLRSWPHWSGSVVVPYAALLSGVVSPLDLGLIQLDWLPGIARGAAWGVSAFFLLAFSWWTYGRAVAGSSQDRPLPSIGHRRLAQALTFALADESLPLGVLSGHCRALDRPVLWGLRGIASGSGRALSEPLGTNAAPLHGKQRAAPLSRFAGCRLHHCLRADGQLLDLSGPSYPPGYESFPIDPLHTATGIALAACRQGHRVRFYNAAGLVSELILGQDEHRLPKFLATALRHHLIVLDELGFIPFSSTGAQLIFHFCSTLYERVAMIVTTNLHFADWTQVFGDERLTAALLDRLTHRAHILEFVGESYRFRQRMQRETEEKSNG